MNPGKGEGVSHIVVVLGSSRIREVLQARVSSVASSRTSKVHLSPFVLTFSLFCAILNVLFSVVW